MNCVGDHVLKIDIGTTQDLASDFRVPSLPILARQNIRSLPNSGYFHQKLDTKNRLLTSCCSGLLAWFTHVGIPVEENSLVKQTESHTEIDFDLLSKLHKLAENCLQDCAPYHPEAPKDLEDDSLVALACETMGEIWKLCERFHKVVTSKAILALSRGQLKDKNYREDLPASHHSIAHALQSDWKVEKEQIQEAELDTFVQKFSLCETAAVSIEHPVLQEEAFENMRADS